MGMNVSGSDGADAVERGQTLVGRIGINNGVVADPGDFSRQKRLLLVINAPPTSGLLIGVKLYTEASYVTFIHRMQLWMPSDA